MDLDIDQAPYPSLGQNDKISILSASIHQIDNPAFLCRIEKDNPNFLEIINCNDQFLKCFDLDKIEVIGNNYDFLLIQDANNDYASTNHFAYAKLVKAVKNLRTINIETEIYYPKNRAKCDNFRIIFFPNQYKTDDIYCTFTLQKVAHRHNEEIDSVDLIHNLERALRNERILRRVSDLIAAGSNPEIIADKISKIICNYLKVDECAILDNNQNSGFLIHSNSEVTENKILPIKQYINFQDKLFLSLNNLRKSNTTIVCGDTSNDARFNEIQDLCSQLKIRSQIVVTMSMENEIIGGLYIYQSTPRVWLLEEIELIEIIANEFSVAIDRSNYTQKLLNKSHELAESLKHEKRMREIQTEFVALVSHEFKTPLQIIDSSRELLERTIKSSNISENPLAEKSLDRIKNSILRMGNLIQSNLDLSKIEMNQDGIKANKQNFNIKNFINEIIEKHSNLVSEKHIEINIDIDKMPNLYYGDAKLLSHSFTNIVVNAIKYSKNNSVVKIFGGIEDDQMFFKVVDNGIGIPKEDLANIGNKFFRAGNTLAVAGTGIGLYLSKYFIELHNGSLSIESEFSVGSSVTIFLPL